MKSLKDSKIKWLEWNKETFAKAKKEDKPVLLSISATWCHWCHRMDGDTFDNDEVAKIVNGKFVPVRIDTDKRPEINDRYNMGGWPTVSILTPSGYPISGGTYIPPKIMTGYLTKILDTYHLEKEKLNSTTVSVEDKKPTVEKINEKGIEKFIEMMKNFYDSDYGGFGYEPKFPHVEFLNFMLDYLEQKDEEDFKKMLLKTLKMMSEGRIYDKVEGGFFRYSTTRDWSMPHFEKMIEDNSKLLCTFLRASKILNEKRFEDVALGIFGYIKNNLYDGKEAFYSSQDADEEYYNLDHKERQNKKKPSLDKSIYTDKNCMMVISLLLLNERLKEKIYLELAENTLEFILDKLVTDKGVKHYNESKDFLLKDHAFLLFALARMFKQTKDDKYAIEFNKIYEITKKVFQDSDGIFFDVAENIDAVGLMNVRKKIVEDNMFIAKALVMRGNKEGAEKILKYFGYVDDENLSFANYADTLLFYSELNETV